MINFNEAPFTGNEFKYIKQAIDNKKNCGNGEFTYKCSNWFQSNFGIKKVLLTTSCTHALEMAAILADIKYVKRYSEIEKQFMKYLLPEKAKFTPYLSSHTNENNIDANI